MVETNTKIEEYDLFVIGGGSGGLSAAKTATNLGCKVGLADYVEPTPFGTKWGLGGTCVNVGCIPKKLMHHAANMYENLEYMEKMGYPRKIEREHVWQTLVKNIQMYVKKMNFGYTNTLRIGEVKYYNSFASFIDKNTISLKNKQGEETIVKAKDILIATGGRPKYPDVPGDKECCITSDDIFSLKKSPGKTLVIGASYIALECGGFLNALGYDVSIMVRSKLLRGFDEDMATRIGDFMERRDTRFINKATPTRFTKKDDGKISVEYEQDKKQITEEFDTVLLAIGRYVDSKKINADKIGLDLSRNGKLITNDNDQTNISNIYSIGDCAEGRPELTPPAIMAGRFLAERLYIGSQKLMNYNLIATTVFTPIEYGAVGETEESAIEKYGQDNLITYHSSFTPLEWQFDLMRGETGYVKIICDKKNNEKIIGFHLVSPNAGEIIQGISVAMNMGVTKEQLDDTVGIHPTVAEEFLGIKKVKGIDDPNKEGC